MNLVYNVVFLSLALHASAQVPSKCGAPPSSYPHMQIEDMKPKKGISSHVQKVLYRCAEGYTQNSGIRSIKCQDGKWTQLTMTCEKKNCGSAGELFNGYFQYMGSFYGDKANAVCNEGFTLKGMEYRICKDSGWSGEIPTCEEGGEAQVVPAEVTCPAPSVANSVKLSETVSVYRVRDSVTLVCSEGFLLTGAQHLTCGPDGQWQPELPLCLPSVGEITCNAPNAKRKMLINGLKQVYRSGDSLSFSCKDIYYLDGSNTVTCGVDGKWTPSLPQCTEIKCPILNITNGRPSIKHRRFGSDVTISCFKGNLLKGAARIKCSRSGEWMEKIPQCVPEGGEAQVVPAEVTCPAPSVANGVKLSETVSVYRVRDSVTLVCSEGFLLTGAQQLTCGPDGQWQPKLPLCLPFNDIIESPKPDGRCGVPPYHSNAHLSDCCRAQADFGPGHRVRYSCALGYMRGRGTYYSTCVSGRWTPVTLRCKRKSCGSAGEMSFGHFVYTGAQFGDTATGVCNEGYQLVGQNVRNCMNDGWDGRVPVCEAVQCAKLPEVVNGEINGHLEPPYVYSTVIGYRCRVGKLIGTSELYCTKDGTWSAPPPECKDIKCPYPKVQYAQMTRGIRMPLEFGDSVTFVCFRGMVMNGPGTVTCSLDGTWTPALPTCQYRRY
ncbi:complement receptor type 2-like isoform X1 [Oncorhynchus keta]|uniref:complement receptor type 2-like isoform X1 n=1 Tax=Oncorhynchus keta TaxID=8018 RepID=UPI0015FC54FB|nr:complement receptor type 2-like isoform X1 [Oncorhynchus keta]